LAREAAAYAKTGLLAAVSKNRRDDLGLHGDFGVLFIHGVGANASQFHSLRRALEPELRCFDDFEYGLRRTIPELAEELRVHIEALSARYTRTMLIGHSLGGLLSLMVMQGDEPPPSLAGLVSICAPLHGTHRSRLAPKTPLSPLTPESPMITDLLKTRDRLEPYRGRILTISAERDAFVVPSDSARLEGHEHVEFRHVGHVATLFDHEVQEVVKSFVLKTKTR
jgi:pimeloyl-ACP methyl ester carboxylesterase